eukprot:5875373-Amphidinium_carterae.1
MLTLTALYAGFLNHVAETRRADVEQMGGPVDVVVRVALAQMNAQAGWQTMPISDMLATLASVVRLNTDSNTWASISHD